MSTGVAALTRRQLRRLVLATSAVLLLEAIFFSALAPLLPHYVGALGISHGQAGLLVGSEAAGSFVAALPAGLVASRWGYKPTVLLALALLTVCTTGFGLAHSFVPLVLLRFAQGCASATALTAALAWLMSASPAERRGQLLGTALGAAAIGSVIGPLLGTAAASLGTAVAFGGVAALFIPLGLAIAAIPAPQQGRSQPLASLLALGRHPRLRAACWLMLLTALSIGALTVIGPLRLDALGWGASAIAAVFVSGAALEGIANPLAGRWLDRRGPRALAVAASGALSLLFLGLGVAGAPLAVAVLVTLATAALGALSVVAVALLSSGADSAGLDRGLSTSAMNLAWAPGNALGSISSGVLLDHGGALAAAALPATLCLGTALLVLVAQTGVRR